LKHPPEKESCANCENGKKKKDQSILIEASPYVLSEKESCANCENGKKKKDQSILIEASPYVLPARMERKRSIYPESVE
jgi:hypothetical protein